MFRILLVLVSVFWVVVHVHAAEPGCQPVETVAYEVNLGDGWTIRMPLESGGAGTIGVTGQNLLYKTDRVYWLVGMNHLPADTDGTGQVDVDKFLEGLSQKPSPLEFIKSWESEGHRIRLMKSASTGESIVVFGSPGDATRYVGVHVSRCLDISGIMATLQFNHD
ncbi:MAG: hypothetical protein D6758_09075 [Gammaproteobacteria bacterium]|nr:MAG: hypothetical protein D6758_09075 [Gammaproteobacteria bacterium]